MAAAGLPLLKLSTLFVKTIAKPLASRLKIEATKRPLLNRLCGGIGNGVHYIYARANIMASGYKFVGIKPLPMETAVADGVGILAEGLVVGFSGAVIIIEASRSAASNAIKTAKAAEDKRRDLEEREARFLYLEEKIARLEAKGWFNIDAPKSPPTVIPATATAPSTTPVASDNEAARGGPARSSAGWGGWFSGWF